MSGLLLPSTLLRSTPPLRATRKSSCKKSYMFVKVVLYLIWRNRRFFLFVLVVRHARVDVQEKIQRRARQLGRLRKQRRRDNVYCSSVLYLFSCCRSIKATGGNAFLGNVFSVFFLSVPLCAR